MRLLSFPPKYRNLGYFSRIISCKWNFNPVRFGIWAQLLSSRSTWLAPRCRSWYLETKIWSWTALWTLARILYRSQGCSSHVDLSKARDSVVGGICLSYRQPVQLCWLCTDILASSWNPSACPALPSPAQSPRGISPRPVVLRSTNLRSSYARWSFGRCSKSLDDSSRALMSRLLSPPKYFRKN